MLYLFIFELNSYKIWLDFYVVDCDDLIVENGYDIKVDGKVVQ